ncbi:MAG: hypothetical protein P8J33_00540 [Pirellulaceae bacterium]|nr:hypothetical protein [Pirellulaceae bacterium]
MLFVWRMYEILSYRKLQQDLDEDRRQYRNAPGATCEIPRVTETRHARAIIHLQDAGYQPIQQANLPTCLPACSTVPSLCKQAHSLNLLTN